MDWIEDHTILLATAIIILLFLSLTYAFIQDQKQWEIYAKEHHCIVSGHIAGNTSTGMSMDGKGTITTIVIPSKTIYSCDEGKTTEVR